MSRVTVNGVNGNAPSALLWMLTSFTEDTPGVTETVVVSSDGFVLVASADDDGQELEQMAAIISGLTSLTKGAADLYELGEVRQIIVEMAKGFLFVMSVGDGSAVGALTTSDCDIGALGYEMTLLTERISDALTPELIDTLKNVLSPQHRLASDK